MGARRYDEAQKDVLRRLRETHENHMNQKRLLRQKIEEEFEAQLRAFEYQESVLMNEALGTVNARGVGVSKTDIGRAVGTANWQILQQKYALAANSTPGVQFKSELVESDGYAFRTLASNAVRGVAALVTRLLGRKLEVTAHFNTDGFLVLDGDIPSVLHRELYGVPGFTPENDRQPDGETVTAWNDLVAAVAGALGCPEFGPLNVLPTEIWFEPNGHQMLREKIFDRVVAETVSAR